MFRPVVARSIHSARHALVALLAAGSAVVALASVACRDVTSPAEDPTTVTYAPGLGIRLSDFTRDTSGVYYQDLAVGSGTVAVPNSTVSYFYTGYLADGRQFDSNVGATSPYTLVLGSGQAVRGFDRGLLGIAAGGRRRLIIPPALAYGNSAKGAAIPAGSILIFVVDVPAVTLPATTTTTTSRAR